MAKAMGRVNAKAGRQRPSERRDSAESAPYALSFRRFTDSRVLS
jgi:hypothetical protein